MGNKRLFIAVEVPPLVIKELQRIEHELKRAHLFKGTYINPLHAHITLKFLGEVDEQLIPVIHERLLNIKYELMYAKLGKLDFFTSKKNIPRLIYCSVICPELITLAQQIDQELADLIEPEQRSFTNHLTLARIKHVDNYDDLIKFIESYSVESIQFDIDSFFLKESVLTPKGPSYSIVQIYR